jgi:hypothetical protein
MVDMAVMSFSPDKSRNKIRNKKMDEDSNNDL